MKTIETEISLDEFKAFVLFEMYYQNIFGLDINDNIKDKINDIMDYHYTKVYGKEYNNRIYDITDEKYKCVAALEKG